MGYLRQNLCLVPQLQNQGPRMLSGLLGATVGTCHRTHHKSTSLLDNACQHFFPNDGLQQKHRWCLNIVKKLYPAQALGHSVVFRFTNHATTSSVTAPAATKHLTSQMFGSFSSAQINSQCENVDRMRSCASLEESLNLIQALVENKSLHKDNLSLVFSTLQEQIYRTLKSTWFFRETHLKKLQVQLNYLQVQLFGWIIDDTRFRALLDNTVSLVPCMSVDDCLQVLHSLSYLFIGRHDHYGVAQISDRCLDSVNSLTLSQLCLLSYCYQPCYGDLQPLGKIVDAAKVWLLSHHPQEVNLADLCGLLQTTKHVCSEEMMSISAQTITSHLTFHHTVLDIKVISQLNIFSLISFRSYDEIIWNAIFNVPSLSCKVNFKTDLTFDFCSSLHMSNWLCPLQSQLRAHALSQLFRSNDYSVHDFVRHAVLLDSFPGSLVGKKWHLILRLIKESDNFLMIQLMKSHLHFNFRIIPSGKEFVSAYEERLAKFFTSLNFWQREDFLWWKNNGFSGKLLFKLYFKMAKFGLQLSQDLVSSLESHLLQDDQWDTPVMKKIMSAEYQFHKLEQNQLIPAKLLRNLLAWFHHLDFNYLMMFYKSLDLIAGQPEVSGPAKLQCGMLKAKLYEQFTIKLSETKKLPSSFTANSTLPVHMQRMQQRTAGEDLYQQLMLSLPRIVHRDDPVTCFRALKVLDMGADIFPFYQSDMFEMLAQFVTGQPCQMVYPAMQLVKVLAMCGGYQPQSVQDFSSWTEHLTSEVLGLQFLPPSSLVQYGYTLSLLGLFHECVLLRLMNLDFIQALQKECIGISLHSRKRILQQLALLNRSVAIECPHLSLPWSLRWPLVHGSPRGNTATQNKVRQSMQRLTGSDHCLIPSTTSPYGHHIDALLFSRPGSGVVSQVDVQQDILQSGLDKIAILCPVVSDYCRGSPVLTGQYQADIRQLQMLGYHVVLFAPDEFSAMDRQIPELQDSYIRSKIISSFGEDIFNGF